MLYFCAKKILFLISLICLNPYSTNAMTFFNKVIQIPTLKRLVSKTKINAKQYSFLCNAKGYIQTSTITLNFQTYRCSSLQEESYEKIKLSKNYANYFKSAAEGNSVSIALFLDDENFDPNIIDYSNPKLAPSALHYAVWENHVDIINLLINDPRTNLFIKDGKGNSPLFYAQYSIDKNIWIMLFKAIEAKLLLVLKTKPTSYATYYPSPKLNIDPCYNSLAKDCYTDNKKFIISVILSNKHLGRERLGMLVLYHSVCEDDFENVLMLLMLGANPNAIIDIDEEHQVMIASVAKNPLILTILKIYGAKI